MLCDGMAVKSIADDHGRWMMQCAPRFEYREPKISRRAQGRVVALAVEQRFALAFAMLSVLGRRRLRRCNAVVVHGRRLPAQYSVPVSDDFSHQ